ncbi:MAG: c-type cytochrome [Betaproteobacteria bacterium]
MTLPFRSLPAVILVALSTGASAQALRTGEQVYKETCFACHKTGIEKAPRFGDRKAWAPLIKEGQHVLTAEAWLGERAMPPKGGNPTLSLEEFARAVAYMARSSGGKWQDPDSAMMGRIRAEETKQLARRKAKP